MSWTPSGELFPEERRKPLPKFVSEKELMASQRTSLEKDLELAKVTFKRITEVMGHPISFDAAKRPGCLEKNRFKTVFPNDSTRVRIRQRPGLNIAHVEGADYINANALEYPLPGCPKPLRFIGTQGPMKSTVHDFWTMVWEQHANVIVMLTDFVDELGREACVHYWPSHGSARFEEFEVECVQEHHYGEFRVSTISIVDTLDPAAAKRTVVHVQYLAWPDFGVPANPDSFLKLHQCVRGQQMALGDEAPLLVHCTAGLGRTGVYILIDVLLRQLTYNFVPNTEAILLVLREQRVGLVQTEEQYAFALQVAVRKIQQDCEANLLKSTAE